jgi:lysophospholipase L1-like esterase
VYVQSNLPTVGYGGSDASNKIIVDQVKQLNAFLKEQCHIFNCTFIDLYPYFEKDDVLVQAYTYDGLHISEAGYQLWTSIIKDLVLAP